MQYKPPNEFDNIKEKGIQREVRKLQMLKEGIERLKVAEFRSRCYFDKFSSNKLSQTLHIKKPLTIKERFAIALRKKIAE